jgi:predicted cobalt transporter CbtA
MGRDLSRPGPAIGTGALVGVVVGLVVALFFSFAGEPRIEDAIKIEQANAAATGVHETHDPTAVSVSRSTQRGVGLFGAFALAGAAFGALLGALSTQLHAQPTPWRRSLVAGACLATSIYVLPWLKYPPNPPAVGDPATVAHRQGLWVSLIVITGVMLLAAFDVHKRLRWRGMAEPQRWTLTAATFVVPMAFVVGFMPPNRDAVNVPAKLIWEFRLVELAGNAMLWTLLTVGFGLLASRAPARAAERELLNA